MDVNRSQIGNQTMLENFLQELCYYAHDAHWILFGLLLLCGLNFPISEDAILITGGAIASTCIPEDRWFLFAWIYAGCVIGAWETYWIGRYFGPKLYRWRFFNHIINPERIEKLHHYYEKFGIFTFIVGRFIPGGFRNALFLTTGLGRMPFMRFVLRDLVAAFIQVNTTFYIGFVFGENYSAIIQFFKKYNQISLLIIFSVILLFIFYCWYKQRAKDNM